MLHYIALIQKDWENILRTKKGRVLKKGGAKSGGSRQYAPKAYTDTSFWCLVFYSNGVILYPRVFF